MNIRSVGGSPPVARPTSSPPEASPAAGGAPAAPPADAVRVDLSEGVEERASLDKLLRDVIRRHLAIDPRTREVVQRTVDTTTGEVLRQFPEEAVLRLRAYARDMTMPPAPQGPGEPIAPAGRTPSRT